MATPATHPAYLGLGGFHHWFGRRWERYLGILIPVRCESPPTDTASEKNHAANSETVEPGMGHSSPQRGVAYLPTPRGIRLSAWR